MTKLVVPAAAAALAALATGCGSSRLSHDAFVKQGNAICASYDTAVARLRTPRTLTQVESYTKRVLPLYRSALGELAALKPPRADELAVRRLLLVDGAIERDLGRLASAARARQLPRVQDVVERARTDNARSNRIARRLGLTLCAKS